MKDIKVFSVLTYEGKALGIRFTQGAGFFDINLESLRGVTRLHLQGHRTERLVEQNGLLISRMERDSGSLVDDYSKNVEYCNYIMKNVLKPNAPTKPKVKYSEFEVTVEYSNFHPIHLKMMKQTLKGTFMAINKIKATEIALEHYRLELGDDDVKVIKITEISEE